MDEALLILRVGAGALFAAHGAQKLFGWFGGSGISGTAVSFESLGLRPGRLHATGAGINEFTGGLLLAFGLLTPLAAALIAATMTAAVWTIHAKNGPFNTNGGWELNALYVLIAFAVAGIGAGAISLDDAFGIDVAGIGWALGGVAAGVLGGAAAVIAGRSFGARSDDSAVAAH